MSGWSLRGGKVIRNTLWLSAAPIFLNVLSIFVVGTIARALGETDFGRFNVAFALAQLCQALAGFGLSTATIRTLSTGGADPPRYAGNMIVLRLVLAVWSHLLLCALTFGLGHDPETRAAALLAGSSLYLLALSTACQDVFASYEDMGPPARASLIGGLALTLGSVAVVLLGGRLYALVLVYVAGTALTTVLSLASLLRKHFVPVLGLSLTFAREAAREGSVFFAGGVLMAVMIRGDLLVLSALRGEAEAGIYAASASIFQKLHVLPISMAAAILPPLATLAAREPRAARDLLERCLLVGLVTTLPLVVGGALLGRPLVDLVFGHSQYGGAAASLGIGLGTVPLLLVSLVLLRALAALHEERLGLVAQAAGTLTMVASELALAPRFGAAGTAGATVLGHLTTCVWAAVYVRGRLGTRIDLPAYAKTGLGLAAMAAFIVLTRGRAHVLVVIGAAGLLYGAALVGMRVVPLDELARLVRARMVRPRAVSTRALPKDGSSTGRSA